MNYFPENLRFLRLKKEKTQEQLARDVGLTRSAIANYENKISSPEYDKLILIAKYLDVSIDDILTKKISSVQSKVYEIPSDEGKQVAEPEHVYVTKKDLDKAFKQLQSQIKSIQNQSQKK